VAQPEPGTVTRLLQSWSRGDKESLNELAPLVYRELRKLAVAYVRRERSDHTLQPTALLHEHYQCTDITSNRSTRFGRCASVSCLLST
jgi:hypothetical protein